jgi:hypothetical protein
MSKREVERVGRQMAKVRDVTFALAKVGDYVSRRLTRVSSLICERIAMTEDGLGFHLVPSQPSGPARHRMGIRSKARAGVNRDS